MQNLRLAGGVDTARQEDRKSLLGSFDDVRRDIDANMDGLETHDVRQLIPHTCTSVEPGIYLKDFGIRSEVDVYIDEHEAYVTGAVQKEVLALLA